MAQRLVRNAMEGGMATRPCPAMITSDAGHTDRCNRNVIIVSLQGHKRRAVAQASNIVAFAGGRAARLPTALTSVHSSGRILWARLPPPPQRGGGRRIMRSVRG